MQENTVERKAELCLLRSFYGDMLTDKEKSAAELYLDEDLSLAEIAEEMGISRQAVHDTLNRAFQKLDELEEKLSLQERFVKQEKKLNLLKSILSGVMPEEGSRAAYEQAVKLLDEVIALHEQ